MQLPERLELIYDDDNVEAGVPMHLIWVHPDQAVAKTKQSISKAGGVGAGAGRGDESVVKDEYEDIDCTPRDFTPRDYTPRDFKDEDSMTGPSPGLGLGPPEGRMHRIQTMQSEYGDGDMKDDDMETR